MAQRRLIERHSNVTVPCCYNSGAVCSGAVAKLVDSVPRRFHDHEVKARFNVGRLKRLMDGLHQLERGKSELSRH